MEPVQERSLHLFHFEKHAITEALTIMPASAEKSAVAEILSAAGMHDGCVLITPEIGRYLCALEFEVSCSLTLARNHTRMSELMQSMRWVREKIEGSPQD